MPNERGLDYRASTALNFVPWWRGESFRSLVKKLGWLLVLMPAVVFVIEWQHDGRIGDVGDAGGMLLVAGGMGLTILGLERVLLSPKHHHAQVLYVVLTSGRPYHYSICECHWFGGVTDDAEASFGRARKHTGSVDDEVVRIDVPAS